MKRLLPPILFIVLVAIIAGLYAFHPAEVARPHSGGLPVGETALALALGLGLLIGARVQFVRRDSEILTFATPRNLVTNGIFRFSRNPMYLGFLLLLVAAALAANIWCAWLAPLAFALAAQLWYIPYEEKAALAAFGQDYEAYRKRTRRWL